MAFELKDVKLTYFPICGRAEPVRLLLEDASVAYEYSGDLAHFKENKLDCSLYRFNQLPRLEVNGLVLAQQDAILRYIAAAKGYGGRGNPAEDVLVDMLACSLEDLNSKYTGSVYSPDNATLLPEFVKTHVPKVFSQYEALFESAKSSSSYLVYDHPSFAEFTLAYLIHAISHLNPNVLADFPLLTKFYSTFQDRENIKKYEASGRRPEMLNGSPAGQKTVV